MDRLLSEEEITKKFCAVCRGSDECSGLCGDYDELVDLLKAQDLKSISARDKEWVELEKAYIEYIDLLTAELKDTSGLMLVHGWQSSRVESGKLARKKIEERKKEIGL